MSFHVEDRHISYRINEDVLSILPADAVHPGTDSSSTVSDLPGPGRTLDKFIGIAGAAIERMCDSIGTRMGLGPHAAMARLVEALLRSRIYSCESEGHNQHCNFDWCNSYFHRDVLRRLQEHPGDLLTLLDATLALTIYYYSSTLQNVLRTVEKECNRIIKYIRSVMHPRVTVQ
ncbi:hypothetical protein OE88DRAFT_926784 [Heliocybe sulcata]|uniref:Uncharacterized protein n=1 Tax=Heliocybe sulcata TaxID=5364 RepID=A0A5C3MNG1_9AGAM|nr:hypothetical protein OE88DRAFT_926784 [Heliocybe sulcata]